MIQPGVDPRFDFTAPNLPWRQLGAVHLIAIGGAGMSAVARLLLALRVPVSGSDAHNSPVLEALRAADAKVFVGHDEAHLGAAQTVVVSSAIREDNVELVAARAAGVRVLHRAQALAAVMDGYRRIAVAGANGKTTTSAMIASALLGLDERPSFALGGQLLTEGTNARLDSGGTFVVEADESDGSFLVYRPDVAVVTNVQPDHLDFYGDFSQVQAAYAKFAATIEPTGLLIACADDPGSAALARVAQNEGTKVCTYGLGSGAQVRAAQITYSPQGTTAKLLDARVPAELVLHLAAPGEHNLLNALGAYAALTRGCDLPSAKVAAAIGSFGGTGRRFERIGLVDGIQVVDDYAHNVGKVLAVISTAAALAAPAALRVIFQPHLYSRTRDFAAQFAQALLPATQVVLLDIYGAREDPIPDVSSELIATEMRARGHAVEICGPAQAVSEVVAAARAGDVLMTIGAGNVTELAPKMVQALEARQ